MILALLFVFGSQWMLSKWIKKSFFIYGLVFFIAAIFSAGSFLKENKTEIYSTLEKALPFASIQTEAPKRELISQHHIKAKVKLNAPMIEQLPELPRGCEVTSLSMLLAYHGIPVDKMELAKEIKKNSTVYKETKHGEHFGDPNTGFVGDMYDFSNPGYGVYHRPVAELASKYSNKPVNDMTGKDFSSVMEALNDRRPVWVIINATYKKLPKNQFTTWHTENGSIHITMKEHSVLVTGYDESYIYFNDPLNKREKAPIKDFIDAWEQMGKQAITL